jgi:hypothetical protein
VEGIVNFFNEIALKSNSEKIDFKPLLSVMFFNEFEKTLKDLSATAFQTGFRIDFSFSFYIFFLEYMCSKEFGYNDTCYKCTVCGVGVSFFLK